jgi:WD40 repeat protein
MPAGSLKKVIEDYRKEKQLCPFFLAWAWFCDVVEGLQALHAAGLVHRDLKPSNVLLDGLARAVVADLGIARRLGSETASLTATGSTVGTFHYMAPEQFENPEGIDPRADQYSLGVMFYELLTGQMPRGRWQPPSQVNPTVPPAFDKILERLLEPRPERRFASLRELQQELLRLRLVPDRPSPQALPHPTPLSGKVPQPTASQVGRRVGPWAAWVWAAWVIVGGAIAVIGALGAFTFVGTFTTLTETAPTHLSLHPAFGHSQAVLAVAWSPDGKFIVTGGNDQLVILWDAQTGAELRHFQGHTALVSSVAFSPDGRQVLTGSGDNTARLWDVATGKELRTFEGHSDWVMSVAFSPDGQQALTGSGDGKARLWDVATGKELCTFEGHSNWVMSVAFSPDGQQALTGSADKTARLWDVETGQEIRRLQHADGVRCVAFSPDGQQVLTGSWDKTARVWDVAAGKEIRRFEGHTYGVNSVAFSPNGRQVVTGSSDLTVRLWDVPTGKEIRRLEGNAAPVVALAVSPNGRKLAAGGIPLGPNSMAGVPERDVHLWDLTVGGQTHQLESHLDLPFIVCPDAVAFSPDGRQILTAGRMGAARLWDVATGQEIRRFQGHTHSVISVAFSPDGKQVLTGSDDTARLWDVATGQEIRRFQHPHSVRCVAFSPDGQQVLTGSFDNTARLWDVTTGREIRRFEGHSDAVVSVAFSPDGRQVVTGSWDETARLWNVATGREIRRFEGHRGWVVSARFSPDCRWMFTASRDGTVRIWNTDNGAPVCVLYHLIHGGWAVITPKAFSYDGSLKTREILMASLRLEEALTGKERPLTEKEFQRFHRPDLVEQALKAFN